VGEIGALGNRENDRFGAPRFRLEILGQLDTQKPGLRPDYVILTGVVIRRLTENVNSDLLLVYLFGPVK
jgi:hypothetical protein